MIVDGKAIAAAMNQSTRRRAEILLDRVVPTLAIVTCDPTFETKRYLALKERTAAGVGVRVVVTELPKEATTARLVAAVQGVLPSAHGVVVQLPLPAHIDREAVLATVPVSHDPDGFQYGSDPEACPSPVVVAIREIADQYRVDFRDRAVVVVGAGRLVGKPAAYFARQAGAQVTIITKETPDYAAVLAAADIIISGAGQPGLIEPSAVKAGVVIFDAGTSEDGGVLRGDVNPAVAEKASVFTPVPGGIGPVTVAALLHNTVHLAERQVAQGGSPVV
jgi:methylenetetrahydrofolate dehydrogenase (NADP+)/methenyltetrahydrofolate cyclohydrolase